MLKTKLLAATILCASAMFAQGLKGEYLKDIAGLEKKYVSLAEAIPADKYGWRPEGARSISEVLMHVAGANAMIPRTFGVQPPAGISREGEKKITDKTQVIERLRASFEHVRKAADAAAESDKQIKMFGMDMTNRGGLTFMTEHLHEHLGQLIAYARMQGVRPPWSQQ